jgi:hypothetical protein
MKLLILLALLLPLVAGAQVQKCTIEGKTVYSDSLCGQEGRAVTATVNTMDTSGMREQVGKIDAQAAKVAAQEKAAQPKRPSGTQGPCYSFDGPAYLSCMKRVTKPVPRPKSR